MSTLLHPTDRRTDTATGFKNTVESEPRGGFLGTLRVLFSRRNGKGRELMIQDSSDLKGPSVAIKVVGIGGGGSNAVSRMFRERTPGAEYVVINTDAQALLLCDVPMRVAIGEQLTAGNGVGGNPDLGHGRRRGEPRRAARDPQGRGHGVRGVRHGRRNGHRSGARDRPRSPRRPTH